MPRISDSDIALVRERSPLDEIVGEVVTLRSGSGGRRVGLCPFHDEKTPSFNVNSVNGFFHCFGCGKSGDVITFVREVEALSFSEAVERLAQRAGITLTYEQGSAAAGRQSGQRARLLAAHAEAATFYAEQLATPAAKIAREFLDQRGFDEQSWATFGVGFAPDSWDTLTKHLAARGFSREELITGGLCRLGQRGAYDAFRGRLLWPIRDHGAETIGFGARRLRDDDPVAAKYVNTTETPLYSKSKVLYGLDLARKGIALRHQAVVVEGYTDVMAAHLAGVTSAVATCGTAFGDKHVEVLRRLLMDQAETPGEVIFTFDGDAAGQAAALKAYSLDQRFVNQTFVAVSPDGMDPCELRLARGDAAVRDLIASRQPLFTFVIRSTLDRFDLDTPDGRVRALAAAAPVVAGIRDVSLRPEYARTLAGWLGMDVDAVLAQVARTTPVGSGGGAAAGTAAERLRAAPAAGAGAVGPVAGGAGGAAAVPAGPAVVVARGSELAVEREALKLAVQRPALLGPGFDLLEPALFTDAGHAALRRTVASAGGLGVGAGAGGRAWVQALLDAAPDDGVRNLVGALAVEPVHYAGDDEQRYAAEVLARLEEIGMTRELVAVKGKLQRTNPESEPGAYRTLMAACVALEVRKRDLRQRGLGAA